MSLYIERHISQWIRGTNPKCGPVAQFLARAKKRRLSEVLWGKTLPSFPLANLGLQEQISRNALDFANNLANGNYGLSDGSQAGDWRLPNRLELESLLHFGYVNPALSNTAGTGQWTAGEPFTNVQANKYYWTSSSHSGNTPLGWYVNLCDGIVNTSVKSPYYVWPVRDEQEGL